MRYVGLCFLAIGLYNGLYAGKSNKKQLVIERKHQRSEKDFDEIENNRAYLESLMQKMKIKERKQQRMQHENNLKTALIIPTTALRK